MLIAFDIRRTEFLILGIYIMITVVCFFSAILTELRHTLIDTSYAQMTIAHIMIVCYDKIFSLPFSFGFKATAERTSILNTRLLLQSWSIRRD